MSEDVPGGDVVAAFLEDCGVDCAFGVSSIHNLPILDAIGRRNAIRFVAARGEAGAVNMADGYARAKGALGVAVTSTGPGAANAAGALLEAWSAGTPLLHITGQVDLPFLDRHRAYNHEAKDQLAMLRSVSKAAFRVWSSDGLAGILRKAAAEALTPPAGPVSVEIPIDLQKARTAIPTDMKPAPAPVRRACDRALEEIAQLALPSRRPLLWAGGGARHAGDGVARLAAMGWGVVTSINGRGILPEDHPAALGAFSAGPAVEALYRSCDFLLIAGSRLRGNETRNYTLALPAPRAMIDIDSEAWGRAYPADRFAEGDAADALARLAGMVEGRMSIDRSHAAAIAAVRRDARAKMEAEIGPYAEIANALRAAMPRDAVWARDVTIANTTWGNRYLPLYGARSSAHAAAGGIGQGVAMGLGAWFAAQGHRKVVVLSGDGGLCVNLGELATVAETRARIVIVVMNDRGYGVVRNIQDHSYGGRHYFADLWAPDFGALAKTMGFHFANVKAARDFSQAITAALAAPGPAMIEVDMESVGPYPVPFGGPPSGARPA